MTPAPSDPTPAPLSTRTANSRHAAGSGRGADCSSSTPCMPRCLRGGHLLHRLLHFLRRHVAYVRRDRPLVPVRVLEHAVPIAPELLLHGHGDLRAGLDGV